MTVLENLEEFQQKFRHIHFKHESKTQPLHGNSNLTKYQQTGYHTHSKFLNNLHITIKNLNYNVEVSKPTLKHYRLCHSLYSAVDITSTENT
jgi:hypothetical protein